MISADLLQQLGDLGLSSEQYRAVVNILIEQHERNVTVTLPSRYSDVTRREKQRLRTKKHRDIKRAVTLHPSDVPVMSSSEKVGTILALSKEVSKEVSKKVSKEETAPAKRRVLSALEDDWKPDWELTVAQEAELAKMRDWAKGGAIRKADWLATFRNWLRRANVPIGNVVPIREVIHIQEGTAEMAAWDTYLRKTTGRNAMRSPKHGGYFPPSRWPPGHEDVA